MKFTEEDPDSVPHVVEKPVYKNNWKSVGRTRRHIEGKKSNTGHDWGCKGVDEKTIQTGKRFKTP